MIHVFSECNVIQKIWNKLGEWLSPKLNLPALTPQNAILGILAKYAHLHLLLNHVLILFKQGIYQCRNTNIPPNFCQIKEKVRLIQKIEYKIAQDNDCLFSHSRKWEKYCISFKRVCTRSRLDVKHSVQCNLSRGDGNWVGVWGKGNLLCSVFSCRSDEVP